MSGICAVWRNESSAPPADMLTLVSRGLALAPGEAAAQRTAHNAGVAVSAMFATQQIHENGCVLVACDAELYNSAALQTLAGAVENSAGNARTAALLAALYQRFGDRFVEKLNGAFSFVLWDLRERKLLAAVDGVGVSRLVYFQNGKTLLIASRIDALLRCGEVVAQVNPRAVANFMNFGVNLAPETIFTQVHRLSPGMLLISKDGNTRTERYWDMNYGLGDEAGEEPLSRRLEAVVEEAVAAQCKSDTFDEVGAYLSGGTDSSTVVGMMSRLNRGPVNAFSIGFEEAHFNELEYAGITASKFKAKHHTYLVSPGDCLEALPHMVRFFDEPFANSSAIPTYFCARLAAANGMKALLAGDGGDELFGGNERYLIDQIFHAYQTVPPVLRKRLIEPLLHCTPMRNGLAGKARRYVQRSNMPAFERFYSYNFLCSHPPEEVFEKDFLTELAGYSVLETPSRYFSEAPARAHLDKLLYLDVKITLGDSDLPKVTQMSELAGIQTRFPFLDRSVMEFSGCIPARLKVKGFQKRYLFKRAFRNLLPLEVIKKKKHGFGIPVSTWLKDDPRMREFSRDVLFSARARNRGYFRRAFLEDLIQKHEADASTYYGDTLWTFFVLELWHRQFVDQPLGVAV
jgi:asparagine synthase (glutamine-hydrolysing)